MTKDQLEAEFDDMAALGAPEAIAVSPWVVMKFGGTSVSTAENWRIIADLVRARLEAGLRPVIVHSALAGVSNALEETLATAVTGNPSDRLAAIRKQHYELAESLGLNGEALLEERLHELEQLVAGVRLVRKSVCAYAAGHGAWGTAIDEPRRGLPGSPGACQPTGWMRVTCWPAARGPAATRPRVTCPPPAIARRIKSSWQNSRSRAVSF